jgi:hypothetical protein
MEATAVVLADLGGRKAVRCRTCRIYAIADDHRPRFFDQARGNLELRLRKRAAELDACARLNAAVWEAIGAPPSDERWLAYLGFGVDRPDDW